MNTRKYSVILGNLGNTCDRFLSSGYKQQPTKAEMLQKAAGIEHVSGIELVGTWDITAENAAEMKELLQENNLQCASIIVDHFGQKRWGSGALASPDADIRTQAIEECIKMIDVAVELDCDFVNLWPGQDGFDYPMSTDYIEDRTNLMDSLRECAKYAGEKNVRLGLEFKMKEPRTHSYLARTADTMLYARECGYGNVGVTIDTGHAFLAYENVGESVALLNMFGKKLFHMHFNDNHSAWDDDMIVGSVRLVEYFEMLYWLERTGYDGWFSMDQYPYREDGAGAIRASVLFLYRLHSILDRVGMAAVGQLIKRRDPVATSNFILENLIAG